MHPSMTCPAKALPVRKTIVGAISIYMMRSELLPGSTVLTLLISKPVNQRGPEIKR